MQKFLYELERKIGRFAIPNLINYFVIGYVAMTVVCMFAPVLYYGYLALDFTAIARGQIWRLVTFIFAPASISGGFFDILFFVITIHLYYLFGHSLENVWGTFRFNFYFFSGILLTILAELILYVAVGIPVYYGGMNYLYQSMFFAFCLLFPDETFMLYFVFPLKAKYLAALDALLLIVQIIQYTANGAYSYAIAIVVAMLNFFIFWWMYRGNSRFNPRQRARTVKFRQQTAQKMQGVTKHKCAICGRTEVSNPELTFRFCSKCMGNYEYCDEHLYTHQHVTNVGNQGIPMP